MTTSEGLEATEVFSQEPTHSPSDRYKAEWNELKTDMLANNLEKLRRLAFNCDLKVSKFRSVCWSVLLRVIGDNPEDWVAQRELQRNRYQKLKDEFARNPHNAGDENDDPLSQSQKSIWNQYFGDQELVSVITQDVVRTFPGVDFFRKPLIRETMINILFNYAREHPYMCYRQGMHEILAPILFVVHCDHQALLHFQEVSTTIDYILIDVLNPKHLEPDSYFIFSRLMSSIESYYRIVNMMPNAQGYFPTQSEIPSPDSPYAPEIEVIGQLNFIRDKILAKTDLHLHNHLLKLDIPLHIFGIRWLRLLFGREFPLQDLLMLWDAIFADSDSFDLPNYILVAMLIRIRDKLLLSDYTTCLTYLMRYPNNVDIGLILRHALHMKMPQKYELPAGAFVYITPKPDKSTLQTNNKIQSSAATLPRNQASKAIPKHMTPAMDAAQRSRSSSLNSNSLSFAPASSETQLQSQLKDLQYSSSTNVDRLANNSEIRENDIPIVDGYRENSPEVLRIELQQAQKILFVSRLQLRKYLEILRRNISRNNSDELNQTLDGMEELCSFLDVRFSVPNPLRERIDPALEADEASQSKQRLNPASPLSPTINIPPKRHNNISESEAKREFVKNLEIARSAFEIQVADDGLPVGFIEQRNSEQTTTTTSMQQNSVINPSNSAGTRYEIPDNGFMKKSTKILGSKREVELTLFRHTSCDDHEGVPTADPLGSRDE